MKHGVEDGSSIDVAPKKVFFLPQKPYNIPGSLRLQIMYPLYKDDNGLNRALTTKSQHVSDRYLLDILHSVRLGDLAARVGDGDEIAGLAKCADWSKILSVGEQQRLSFARAVYNNPSVIILDESTSGDLTSLFSLYVEV